MEPSEAVSSLGYRNLKVGAHGIPEWKPIYGSRLVLHGAGSWLHRYSCSCTGGVGTYTIGSSTSAVDTHHMKVMCSDARHHREVLYM